MTQPFPTLTDAERAALLEIGPRWGQDIQKHRDIVFGIYDRYLAKASKLAAVEHDIAPLQRVDDSLRSGTPLRATWSDCDGPGRLHLRGRIDTSCSDIRGVLSDAAGSRRFSAHRAPDDTSASSEAGPTNG